MQIEKAASGRSICVKCRKKIKIGSIRLETIDFLYGTRNSRFRCIDCAERMLKSELIERRELLMKIKWHKRNERKRNEV
jgi:hypothetical protein